MKEHLYWVLRDDLEINRQARTSQTGPLLAHHLTPFVTPNNLQLGNLAI